MARFGTECEETTARYKLTSPRLSALWRTSREWVLAVENKTVTKVADRQGTNVDTIEHHR
jgi:hypothetical protein